MEVEADTLDQVREFLAMPGIHVILLDNMTTGQMREAVQLRGAAPVKLEASGGVTLATVREIALTGVDFISVGALTHSAGSIDFSLELTPMARAMASRVTQRFSTAPRAGAFTPVSDAIRGHRLPAGGRLRDRATASSPADILCRCRSACGFVRFCLREN